jgi:hypothetical protein
MVAKDYGGWRSLPRTGTDPRVDAYISAMPEWQQPICHRVRETAHETDPEVEETINRTVQPYFVLQGNIVGLQATKDHVNVSCKTRRRPTRRDHQPRPLGPDRPSDQDLRR